MDKVEVNIELVKAKVAYETNRSDGYKQALTIYNVCSESDLYKEEIEALKIIAGYYQHIGDYVNMLQTVMEGIDKCQTHSEQESESHFLNDLGAVYNFMNDHQTRLEVNLKCLSIRNEVATQDDIICSINNIGDTYLKLEDYKNAENWFIKGLDTKDLEIQNECILNHNLGELYFMQNQFEQAIPYFKKAITLAEQSAYTVIECEAKRFLGKCLIQLKESKEGYTHLISSCNIALRNDLIIELSDIYKDIAEYHENRRDIHNAYGYLKKHLEIKNRLFEAGKLEQITTLLGKLDRPN